MANKTARPTFLDQREQVACLMIRATVPQPPGGATAGPQRFSVQGCRDPSHRVAALAQVTDFGEHTLLAGVGFDVLAVRTEPEPEPDVADPLPTGALVPQRVPRAFPNRKDLWGLIRRNFLEARSWPMYASPTTRNLLAFTPLIGMNIPTMCRPAKLRPLDP